MGYYTNYSLEAIDEVIDYLRSHSSNAEYALNIDGETYFETKWYNHEQDLIEVSKKRPGELIVLKGIGEEDGDVWEKHFFNGTVKQYSGFIQFKEVV